MTSQELRQKFLDFFKEKGHTVIPSASLVPENDPSVLFTTAGMHPLVPYLLGEKHPGGKRLTDVQKCVRTDDIDEVGDKVHHTFFEMLGNWSLGDYFKKEAIEWSWEFLTSKENLGLNKDRLAVSVFAGDNDAPFDQEAFNIWRGLGIAEEKIARLPKKDNWWGPAGLIGPCGPDTEMFYWTGEDKVPTKFDPEDKRWVEIWNDVFMQYNKTREGKYELLLQKNVDTGMGLERALAILNGFDDDYRTELFWPIIQEIEEISGKKYGDKTDEEYIKDGEQCWVDVRKQFRIIADHIKAVTFAIADGAEPSNKDRGSVVRRLMRRALVHTYLISGKLDNVANRLYPTIVKIYGEIYPEITKSKVLESMNAEEIRYGGILVKGVDLIGKDMTPDKFFDLFQSHGLHPELTLELMAKRVGFENVDRDYWMKEFQERLKAHQELSRTASAGMFKGGLADAGEIATKYHTATHLLHAALRKVLGDHVYQKGSNITAERMRFDFSHPQKLTPEQIKEVEDLVNEQIKKDLPVNLEEMTLEDAQSSSAIGVFESKYGEKVKVYTIGQAVDDYFSKEICGGPHTTHTGELGHFKIVKEEASSAGVRRIKAVLE